MHVSLNPEIEFLYSLQKFGIKLGLENTINFLKHIENPERRLKVIHVAGSNGKGSTASYIASILMEAGFKVGLYTSPHFITFNERILFDGEYIDDLYIKTFIQHHKEYIIEFKLTFFEVTTALAFSYFAEKKVEFAVVETGLGGRLDATNVVTSIATVITSISLEHTDVLGNTISEIAEEKAAIIKQDAKVFIGKLPDDALSVIERTCAEKNAELFEIEDYIIERDDYIELYTEELDVSKLDSPLFGEYQRRNAALAILTVYETLAMVKPHIFEAGIAQVVQNTKIQGRFEVYRREPTIIMDSAHNPEGLDHFIKAFRKIRPNYSKSTLLFTALKDKAVDKMLHLVQNDFDSIIFTTIDFERAFQAAEINVLLKQYKGQIIFQDQPSKILQDFLYQAEKTECLVVTGSMYLLGAIKQDLKIIQ